MNQSIQDLNGQPSRRELKPAITTASVDRLVENRRSARRFMATELFLIIFLFGGFFTWAAVSQIAGAVIASGIVRVETSSKKIQHPTGGVIGEILVKDGDSVEVGDVLIRLDAKAAHSELAIYTDQLNAMKARRARLLSEREGKSFDFASVKLDSNAVGTPLSEIIVGETRLFEARQVALISQKKVLVERKNQFENEIGGANAQIVAKQKEIELLGLELKGVEELFTANLASVSRVMPLRRELARAQGDLNVLGAQIAQLKGKIDEVNVQITSLDQERLSEVNRDLQELEPKLAEIESRKAMANEVVQRVDVRAPVSGFVSQLAVHTIGGVIQSGETLMQIVPRNDPLTIEAAVAPSDIDQVKVGGKAMLRLTAYNRRVTPELSGVISTVSADAVRDDRTGQSSYSVKISVSDDEFAKLSGTPVIPGMLAEVYIETTQRTVLSYLLKPATDQFAKVFREK